MLSVRERMISVREERVVVIIIINLRFLSRFLYMRVGLV